MGAEQERKKEFKTTVDGIPVKAVYNDISGLTDTEAGCGPCDSMLDLLLLKRQTGTTNICIRREIPDSALHFIYLPRSATIPTTLWLLARWADAG